MFRDLLGPTKYRAHLNFWYGVVVEEALQLSAEEEARKRHTARGYSDTEELVENAFTHAVRRDPLNKRPLADEFRQEAGIEQAPRPSRTSPSTCQELHLLAAQRARLKIPWDPARRTAFSDTRKGIRLDLDGSQ